MPLEVNKFDNSRHPRRRGVELQEMNSSIGYREAGLDMDKLVSLEDKTLVLVTWTSMMSIRDIPNLRHSKCRLYFLIFLKKTIDGAYLLNAG